MISKVIPVKGSLLISEPFMTDPNFKRSVVLLTEHAAAGTVGYILNHKSDFILKDLIPDCWDADFQVYLGGPVAPDTLHFIHQSPDKIPGSQDLGNGLYWGGDFESLKIQINNYNIKEDEIRFFIGYSGWIVSNKYHKEMVFEENENHLWKEAIVNMGVKYAHISNFPEDPSLN
jgi:putative transcriptional regulator